MCGIAGIYHLHGTPSTQDQMTHALRCMAHRGPDDEGIYRNGRAVLGHRRLSIIDTSPAGHQPFTDQAGRYTIAFNGEIFNYKELRAELEASGHRFRSHTDTEVVLRLYAEKGDAFLHDLNGFFALAIHDAHQDSLFLARDRYGVKPLLWCTHEDRVLFSSELRGLMALGAVARRDDASLAQYFTYHYIAAPHTILHQVHKLEPGQQLHVDAQGARCSTWYDLPAAANGLRPAADPIAQLQDLLDDAVRLRLIADVPVGTFLSGGLDSSIISALAARHHSDLRTFSIGFAEDPFFDESRYAEQVAAHIGSDHTTFQLTRNDLAEGYSRFLTAVDEPFADSSALPSFLLCEKTRSHVTVALSGDGADEVFGGYRKHQAELRYRTPGMAEKALLALAPLWRRLPRSRNNPLSDLFRKLDRFARSGSGSEAGRWLAMATFDSDGDRQALLPHVPRPTDREGHMARGLKQLAGMNGYLLNDVLTVLPNDMLYKVDLTSMAHGLEVRTPFLDRRVVELAFSLPAQRKLKRGAGKYLLREAFGTLLPEDIVKRPKKGFEVPLRDLLLGPLDGLVNEVLERAVVEDAGLCWQAVQDIRKRLASRDPGASQATVHALLVYLVWRRTTGQRSA